MFNKDSIVRESPVPLYYQLKQLLLAEIKKGSYEVGSNIPTENQLMEEFGLSRTTVRQAITELVNEGYLTRNRAKGTVVNPPKVEQRFIQVLAPYYNDEMRARGLNPKTEVLQFRELYPDDFKSDKNLADDVGFREPQMLFYVKRLRFANGEPMQIMEDYFHESCAFFRRMSIEQLQETGITRHLKDDPQTRVVRVTRYLWAAMPTKDEAALLGITVKMPLQLVVSRAYNAEGGLVQYTVGKFRSDRNTFAIELRETI